MGVRVTPGLTVLNTFEICNPPEPDIIQTNPDVVYNGENYQVVWSDEKYGVYYVTAGRVAPDGAVLDTGICISTGSGGYEYQPKIAFDGNRCLVVWPKDLGVQGRFVNQGGLPEGSVLSISASGSGPACAFGDGAYLIAWFYGSFPVLDIKARLFSTAGMPIGPELTLTTDGDCNRWPDVIYDGHQFMVVWTRGANSPASQYVWAQAISSAGSLIGGNFIVSAATSDQRWFPAIACSDTNYFIAWGQSGAASNIMGNVDKGILGIHEINRATKKTRPYDGPTVMNRSAFLKHCGAYRVFDRAGRDAPGSAIRPGVYFIALDRGEIVKVVVIE